MVTIIAEKPSVCASIALAVGATTRHESYWEGNGYFVSYAFGHLYTLVDTKDYNPEMTHWNVKDYPFVPEKFIYKPIDNPGISKQIKVLKELVNKSNMVINGCDMDVEGSLIFLELREDLKITKPMKRLLIKSNTPKAILDGMANLVGLQTTHEEAGRCRQQLDWLIGINFTVLYSLLATGGEITLKCGRNIFCVLKLIFDREVLIANFKSKPFYMLKSRFVSDDNENYIGTYFNKDGSKFIDKELLSNIEKSILNKPGIIIKKEGKKSNENPSKLFSLTDLQGFITKNYDGFTSDSVLDVMQSLYEKKHLTYPRTPSNYLNDADVAEAKESLNAILCIPELNIKNKIDVKFHSDKKVFDTSKVDSHPAIIPTYIIPNLTKLSEQEKIVYIEVSKRFISQFMPSAVYDTLEIITKVDDYEFITRGKALVEEGWKQLYATKDTKEESNQDNEDQADDINIKNIKQGDTVKSDNIELREGKTKPPAHYIEDTLLKTMKSCGKDVENEEEVLKGYTIGTAATRGDAIKKLFDCQYISQKGKNILITDLGTKLIHYFPIKKLLRTDFTGQIQKALKSIENGEYESSVFMQKMTDYVVKSAEEFKKSEIPQIRKKVVVFGICPKCGKRVVENEKAYSCEATRTKECNFTLWKEDKFWSGKKKKLTNAIAKDLITKKKAMVKGFKSTKKEGDTYDALVMLSEDAENKYWNLKLSFDDLPKKKSKSKFKPKVKHVTKFK
ncbi:type IA DNA topoisomerase [Clostridium estertheticum]|uniref:type IA DNA topoisomerase n=1 Tax=Clostridium estertheticum TaxID=238834 RepID=UPI001C0D079D|nr:type IA DNA topoisomerase [Clostridium estertheticum]MBU3173306.1 hypothetical protein [Clostridium estertheticum]